ncbi:MAG: hypothetical protein AABX04_08355 [Nanoarchaeota archaeon]
MDKGSYTRGMLVGAMIVFTTYRTPEQQKILTQTTVQAGYIAPSKLEIQCKDLDGNGELETILKVGTDLYLLKEVEGKPIFIPYEAK